MALNVKLLRKIKKHILEKPRRFLMRTWLVQRSGFRPTFYADDLYQEQKFEKCGTAACIAGWTCLLAKAPVDTDTIQTDAADILGIGRIVASQLFYVDHWPSELSDSYETAKTPRKRAEIAAKRIDLFIKEHKGH